MTVAIRPERVAGDLADLLDHPVAGESRTRRAKLQPNDWDQFVERVGGDVVQTTAWAAAKRLLGFEVAQVVCGASDGSLVGGAQLIVKRIRGLGAVGYIAKGPLLCREQPDRADEILSDIERSARARRVRHLIVQPPPDQPSVEAALDVRGYVCGGAEVAPTATLRLDLRQDLGTLQAGMSESRRRQRRRAVQARLESGLGTRDDLNTFHALHAATAAIQGFRPVSLNYLVCHWDKLRSLDAVEIVLIREQGRAIAGIWLTTFGDTVTFRLAGWNRELAAAHPNVAAHWFAIRRARERGFRYYDLGGLPRSYAAALLSGEPVPDHMLQSPARFKVSFGGTPQLLPEPWHLTFNPFMRKVVRALVPRLSQGRFGRALLSRMRSA